MDTFLVLATTVVYTRYYSNPTAVLCAGNFTLFAHKEHNHGFPDFPVHHYSYFLSSTRYFLTFSWLSSIPHFFMYTRYIVPYVLEYYIFLHTWYINTWYIRTAVYLIPWYHATYFIYYLVFIMCATDVYLVAGLINRVYSGNTFARALLTPNREQTVTNRTKP